jgi:asparagine synthase (glutamine-hydrolysing)
MCGLVGAAGLLDSKTLEAVARMNDAQVHRGPDGQGSWSSAPQGTSGDFEVALGHRRLAIIDLSPGGAQPMHDGQTGCVLVFNGEIYNYRALRDELVKRGDQFSSTSDTEVILRAYAAWGLGAVTRFRGIFAFALWDPRTRALHLVRDPMGIKPLYWTVRGRTVYFASELRALLAGGAARRLDPSGVASFLWHGFVVGPQTMIDGVRLLPAAAHVTLTAGDLSPEPTLYWRLPAAREGSTSVEALGETLRETVRMQLISDVPLGVFLSGGVDSSAVAALACEVAGGAVKTFNIGFDEPELDESRYAAEVARGLGTEHRALRITEDDFRRQLPQALDAIDQPTFDAINTYLVSRAVREAGMTVALAGTGGDELFGGYRSFVDLPRAARMPALPHMVGSAVHAVANAVTQGALALGEVPPQTRWGKLADVLTSGGDFVELYQSFYALFSSELYERLAAPVAARAQLQHGLTAEQLAASRALTGGQRTLHTVTLLELGSFIRERLLRDTDMASMAVSLEARVPLLDHAVIEAAAGVRQEERFLPLGRKEVLKRAALSRLDPKIFDRPKSGFVLPIDAWCRRGLRATMDQLYRDDGLCARAGVDAKAAGALWRSFQAGRPGIYWSRVWAIFVLLHWCARHEVSL